MEIIIALVFLSGSLLVILHEIVKYFEGYKFDLVKVLGWFNASLWCFYALLLYLKHN